MDFRAPIPGESLTGAPRNYPWERPPEISDPEEAIRVHLDRLSEPEKMKSFLDLLELDVDVVTLTEGLLRSAVANGIHTIDVSLLIAPVIHEFIKTTADMAGIEYNEGLEDKNAKEKQQKKIELAKAAAKLRKMKIGPKKEEVQEAVELEVEAPEEAAPMQPRGLMTRGM